MEDVQTSFLNLIKDHMPDNLSFADELADILHISKDSAYRRIRSETTLSLDEIQKLCNHFGVSIDTLLGTSQDQITFQYRSVGGTNMSFEDWLISILGNLKMINRFDVKEIIYLAKDVPPFHYFQIPQLSEFKCFVWRKTILEEEAFKDKKFSFGLISERFINLGKQVWDEYVMTPSLEVWSFETINITLRQIEFYLDCGLFENESDALVLLGHLESLIKHVKNMAEAGKKFLVDSEPSGDNGNFTLYTNEVSIADTTIFFKMADTKIAFITHNTLNTLATSNEIFCENTENYINNLLKKSNLISTTSEKERIKFFNRLDRKLNKTREILTRKIS